MNHYCFIKTETEEELVNKASKLTSLITFDFEAYTDELTNNRVDNLVDF